MPWIEDRFYYTRGILKDIARCYDGIYGGLTINDHYIVNDFDVAEFKADFDRALDELGRAKWDGITHCNFSQYKYFDRKQRIIIAYILGLRSDDKLEAWGFWEARKYRYKVLNEMVSILNERRAE